MGRQWVGQKVRRGVGEGGVDGWLGCGGPGAPRLDRNRTETVTETVQKPYSNRTVAILQFLIVFSTQNLGLGPIYKGSGVHNPLSPPDPMVSVRLPCKSFLVFIAVSVTVSVPFLYGFCTVSVPFLYGFCTVTVWLGCTNPFAVAGGRGTLRVVWPSLAHPNRIHATGSKRKAFWLTRRQVQRLNRKSSLR